jgi:hypothetical protein
LQVSVSRDDSAEYYKATYSAVHTFNSLIFKLTALVESVRGYTPTSRSGSERIWGPFSDDKNPGWETRIVMRKSTDAHPLLHMDYWVQLRQVGQDNSGWISLLVGQYTSQGSARTGDGEIHFNVQDARDANYPVNNDPGLADLHHLDVCYVNSGDSTACKNTNGAATFVEMDLVNLPTTTKTQAATYVYELAQDNSGHMQFDWQVPTDNGRVVTATMLSRWRADGAGRADVIADFTPQLPTQTTLGTDCWRPDTVATYSYRRYPPPMDPPEKGSAALCVFF